ncbi:uncharacterized protein C8A04DRAFT_12109 [Dichotomopilus funicola]|uniref:F-box domain-containing protein n=1 Tax=Dichotomopilus funicola TaxID=1934379 RepID=A0AAN6ZNM9_9PEZI|nr:hypothetical protein C8A04DRAFT_12109 [Dichotomopilus funicola]
MDNNNNNNDNNQPQPQPQNDTQDGTNDDTQDDTQNYTKPFLPANPQHQSPLFTLLPPELRTHIYTLHLRNTRLTTGARLSPHGCRAPRQLLTPAPHTLALLYVCRAIYDELATSWSSPSHWLRHVLFDFAEPYTMLDTFFWMPRGMLQAVKRVRVGAEALVFTIFDESTFYSFAGAFKLLPGLRLDELTVLGCPVDEGNSEIIRDLLRFGGGWRRLRFVAHGAGMLLGLGGSEEEEEEEGVQELRWEESRARDCCRQWESMLRERDGKESGSSVFGYVARERKTYGVVLDPERRVEFYRSKAKGPDDEYLGEAILGQVDNIEREVLIIVTRGAKVDIEDKEDSPFVEGDPREHEFGSTWDEISVRSCWGHHRHPLDPAKHGPSRVDVYRDPEEYSWSKQHLCKDEPYHWDCSSDKDAELGSEPDSDEIVVSETE